MDTQIFGVLGRWVAYFDEALHKPAPTGITVEGKPDDFLLRDGNAYYLFCYHLPMVADPNVALQATAEYESRFRLPERIRSIHWMDTGEPVAFCQEGDAVSVQTVPFVYGRSLVVRVAKMTVEESV